MDDLRDGRVEPDQRGDRSIAAPIHAAMLTRFFQPGTQFPQLYALADLGRYLGSEIANDRRH